MKARQVNDVAILAPHGWLMGDKETDQLDAAIRKLLESGNRRLILDMIDVKHMNSAAIGMLVACRSHYADHQGAIKLCHVDDKIESMLVITKLVQLFDVYGTEREALESFNAVKAAE